MTPTLSKYIDIDNIPKKYGGNLDWKFGDMPALDPSITESLRWKEVTEEKGHKTLPIGPIKWQYDAHGDLAAMAVGSEDGKKREKVIAGLHPEKGVARLALSPGRDSNANFFQSTAAKIPTPPPSSQTSTKNEAEALPSMSSDANLNIGKDPDASVSEASRRGTYTVPYKDMESEIASPPPDSRAGTSETRMTQQAGTHAEGTLSSGTPETKIDSQGSKQVVMDPHTVGQAPKEHPLPIPEEPAPGVVEQAKDMAGQAVEQAKQIPAMAMNAVGMGKEEESKEEETKKEDPKIDQMDGKKVEEFLRDQTKSKQEESAADKA